MPAVHHILLIDDDEHLAPPLAAYLRRFDFTLEAALTPSAGFARLAAGGVDLAVAWELIRVARGLDETDGLEPGREPGLRLERLHRDADRRL